jgi:protease-4
MTILTMSTHSDPMYNIPNALPASSPPPSSPRFGCLGCAFALSFLGNILAIVLVGVLCAGLLYKSGDSTIDKPLPEKYHSGSRTSSDKIAIVRLEGVILEGTLDYLHRQLDQVGADENVKAVVLRINSPGGSITASEDIYRRVRRIVDGDPKRKITARPVIASMGSVAASGGYYVAAPAAKIYAERSTLTGSIGVYASLPNVKELGKKVGVHMNTIKAGEIKDSGSIFGDMTDREKQVLQDMVDDAYVQFLEVVEKGRPKLTRARMLERFTVSPIRPDPKIPVDPDKPPAPYVRYRADGGTFSAVKAKELDLIDAVGTLDDAIDAAAAAAEISTYHAIRYKKQLTFTDLLLGVRSNPAPTQKSLLDPAGLREALSPRMWYLAPGHEATALATAAGRDTEE